MVGAVVGEYLGSTRGLGYVISQAEGTFDTTGVFAGMTVLGTRRRDRQRGRHPTGEMVAAVEGMITTRTQRTQRTQRTPTVSVPLCPWCPLCLICVRHVVRGATNQRRSRHVRIAIGGQNQMVYLPTTLAQELGFYRDEGHRRGAAGLRRRRQGAAGAGRRQRRRRVGLLRSHDSDGGRGARVRRVRHDAAISRARARHLAAERRDADDDRRCSKGTSPASPPPARRRRCC